MQITQIIWWWQVFTCRIFRVGTFASCTHLNATVEKLNHKSVNHIFFGLVTEPLLEPLRFVISPRGWL